MEKLKQGMSILASVIIVALLVGASGCFNRSVEPRAPLPDIVWPPPPETPRIRFVNSISKAGDLGISPGMLKRFFDYMGGKPEISIVAPYGVETDSSGGLYVVDTFLRTVHVFTVRGNEHDLITVNGVPLTSPVDLVIDDGRDRIFVSDSKEGVVKIFKEGGEFAGEIGKGIFERPTGVAINEKTSELLVVDTVGAKIFRFGLADLRVKGSFGGDGSGEGRFHYPTNIFTAPDGAIFVTDSLNFRIQVFSPEGKFIRKFGSPGDAPGYFSRPKGVAVDSDGNIYVVDGLFDNVQIFDKEGRLLIAFGEPGHDHGQFWLPTGIYIDKNDVIYVSDPYNKRVQVFQYIR